MLVTTAQLRLRAMFSHFQPFFSTVSSESPLKVINVPCTLHTSPFQLEQRWHHISFFMKTISGKANRKQRKLYLRFKLTVFFF